MCASGPKRDDAGPAPERVKVLLGMVEALLVDLHPGRPARRVTLDNTLDRDLGIDSLGRMELLARIEREFGVTLPDQLFAEADTPRDLLRALQTAVQWGAGPKIEARAGGALASAEGEPSPDSAQTLIEAMQWHAQAQPEREHIHLLGEGETSEAISYGRLWAEARRVGAGLQREGLLPGETVLLMLPTSLDYFCAFLGTLLAGGVPVPIYPPARASQLEDHLRRQASIAANCQAAMMITVSVAQRVARLLRHGVVSLRKISTIEDLCADEAGLAIPPVGPQDIAFLQYTSGSTGHPKGVILNHANLLANIRADGAAIGATSSDVFVSWLPLYHDMGLIGAWMGSLYFGVPLVLMSPVSFLAHPRRWLWTIHNYGGTLSAAPNFAYELCLARIRDQELQGLDLSRWRVAFNGAEAVSPQTIERFCERFGRWGFRREAMFPVYGLAECAVGLTFPPLERGPRIDRVDRRALSERGRALPAEKDEPTALQFVGCGHPLPGHEVRIAGPDGTELPERHEGRIQFRGPSATSGYFRNAEATRRLFVGDWLDSGDLGYMAAGELYITGRAKDIILRAGRNIYPEEIEEAIGDLPGIRKGRVVVFAAPDPRTGTERLVVLAETREQDPSKRDALRAEVVGRVTDLAWTAPDEVVIAPPDSVLKTSSGKLRRADSRQRYLEGQIGRRATGARCQVLRLSLAGFGAWLRRNRRAWAARSYSAYAWGVFRLIAVTTGILVVIAPNERRRWPLMRRALQLLARASATPLAVQGLEHLPKEGEPCVFVSNHCSYLDSYALVAVVPRCLSFVAKGELRQNRWFELFLGRIGTVFVERFDAHQSAEDARQLGRAVLEGRSLMIYPEGTFSRMPGLLPFHLGAFVAAEQAGVPVVPIAIRGTRQILRGGEHMAHHGAISVVIGPAIDPRSSPAADAWQRALHLRDRARAFILRHNGEPDLAQERAPIEVAQLADRPD